MKLQRHGFIAGLVVGVLALSACGSDNNDSSSSRRKRQQRVRHRTGRLPRLRLRHAVLGRVERPEERGHAVDPAVPEPVLGRHDQLPRPPAPAPAAPPSSAARSPFAGSDSRRSPTSDRGKADARCCGGKAIDLPMVLTPVEFVYNVNGVSDLPLTPSILAKIFSGKITNWNDPAIAAANGRDAAGTTIITVHRVEDSGTTQNFTSFLAAQVPDLWTYGNDQVWKAPGGQGAAGSAAWCSR